MRRALSAIARRRQLMFEFDILSEIEPVKCDTKVVQLIERTSRALGINSTRIQRRSPRYTNHDQHRAHRPDFHTQQRRPQPHSGGME